MNEVAATPVEAGDPSSPGATPPRTSPREGRTFGRLLVRGGLFLVRPGRALWRYGARHPLRLLAASLLLALLVCGVAFGCRHLWGAYHLRAARDCLERYYTEEAKLHLMICLRVRPKDPEVLLLAARTARRTGLVDLADESLTEYEKLRGVDDALVLERMLLRAERGEFESVRKFLWARVEQQQPDAPLVLEALAHAALRFLRLDEMDRYLDRWQALQPDNTQALLFRGAACELRQQRREAASFYRKAVEIDPQHDEARLRLANTLVDLGRGGEARPHLEYLRARQPDNPQIGVRLAQCKEILGQQAEAARELDAVLAAHPDFPSALAERGRLALAGGQLEEAEAFLRRAVSFEPGTYSTRYHLYTCLTRRGKNVEAKEEAEQLKTIEADLATLAAITTSRMQRAPHDPSLHYQVAQIALRAGQVEDAVRWLHSALRADPTYAPAHQLLLDTGEIGHGLSGRITEQLNRGAAEKRSRE